VAVWAIFSDTDAFDTLSDLAIGMGSFDSRLIEVNHVLGGDVSNAVRIRKIAKPPPLE